MLPLWGVTASRSLGTRAETYNSNGLGRLHDRNLIPNIICNPNFSGIGVRISTHRFTHVLTSTISRRVLITLSVGNGVIGILLGRIRRGPVAGTYLRISFRTIASAAIVRSVIPIVLRNSSTNITLNNILSRAVRRLTVVYRIGSLPRTVGTSISNLGLNRDLHVTSLGLPSNMAARLTNSIVITVIRTPHISNRRTTPTTRRTTTRGWI